MAYILKRGIFYRLQTEVLKFVTYCTMDNSHLSKRGSCVNASTVSGTLAVLINTVILNSTSALFSVCAQLEHI